MKKSAYIIGIIGLLFAACGEQANPKDAKKEGAENPMAVTCPENSDACGHGIVSLAPANAPAGTTVNTTIYDQNNTSSRQNFASAPITQRYGLKDGSYCFTATNVFKPINPAAFAGTGLTPRSLVEVQTTDACFTVKAPSDVTVPVMVAIIDNDQDGTHDYRDINPNDPCIPRTDNAACQAKQSGGVSGVIVGTDGDNDGCIDTVGKTYGWCWPSPPTAPTTTSYAWWTQTEASTWKCQNSCQAATVISDSTRKAWVVRMVILPGSTMAHQAQLVQTDGPLALGDVHNFSGRMACTNTVSNNAYLEIENAQYTPVSNMYYPVAVTPSTSVPFSSNYTVTAATANRRSTIKVGELSQATGNVTCDFWYLRDMKLP